MAISRKALLAALAGAALIGGCASGPYYDGYGYDNYGYGYGDPYAYGYGPAYVGPSVGLGFTYYDRDDRHWRRDRDGDRHWRGRGERHDRVDRGPRGDRIDRGVWHDPTPRDAQGRPDYDGTGPGKWERDGHGNMHYAPDGGKDARDANSASPG